MSIKTKVVKFAYRSGLFLKKHSPEILTGAGIVLAVGATVSSGIASTHISDVKKEHQAMLDQIAKNRMIVERYPDEGLEYTDNEEAADRQTAALSTAFKYAKLYFPTVLLTGLSITCVIRAHHILNNRYAAAAAAFVALGTKYQEFQERVAQYRQQVVDEYGEDKDREFAANSILKTEVVDGKEVTTQFAENDNPTMVPFNGTERFFDQFCPSWDVYNPEMNIISLKNFMARANSRLQTQGHLFLNEVYDIIGIPHTPAGALMGWVLDDKADETFVDFGVFNGTEDPWDFSNDMPWDGRMGILLHFNVDKDFIYDRI